ncbi:Dynamin- protein [Perkinsus chesapeaki]|uniref:Dynamin- protein n=1 Tax=Perkinsus chesapeaki TaxID=330153 RepID=A0A7J6MI81_PERCH|nr:Dynamin- protein [Perkinsus chesapeaki]
MVSTNEVHGDDNKAAQPSSSASTNEGHSIGSTPGALSSRSELLNLVSQIKSRVQDKLTGVDFPIPQFILIGRQSVGKSRLVEALAGEQFNFVSGTLGSRRPTVLEFRNDPSLKVSRWQILNTSTQVWEEKTMPQVLKIVSDAHESLGASVSRDPIYVRVEGRNCVDMQITDLPGFREFALDKEKQSLADQIDDLVSSFMHDPRNVMLCVEEAGDAANLSTLARCKRVDPYYNRTILIRNKLDKYYRDLTAQNVNEWLGGYGDLPDNLIKFCLTLPFWDEKHGGPPKPFIQLRKEMNDRDIAEMKSKGASQQFMQYVGFDNFARFMEKKIESLFTDSIGPCLRKLQDLDKEWTDTRDSNKQMLQDTDPNTVVNSIRAAGRSFAEALNHVMEGTIRSEVNRLTLADELYEFQQWVQLQDFSQDFPLLPTDDFSSLDQYIEYLETDCKVPSYDQPLNGGAQFKRLKFECEVFFRFSDICIDVSKRDVIQARGVSVSQVSWQDVILKLLAKEGQENVRAKIAYVGRRIEWFFLKQKEVVIEFMDNLKGSCDEHLYSQLFSKRVRLIKDNETCRELIYQKYDEKLEHQYKLFSQLFSNTLQSTFANPWALVKASSWQLDLTDDGFEDMCLPSFDDTKARIPIEIEWRSRMERKLRKRLNAIPTDPLMIDEAVEKIQTLMMITFINIRNCLCDQLELFADSFFQLPMARHLQGEMSTIQLRPEDRAPFMARRKDVQHDLDRSEAMLEDIEWCIDQIHTFASTTKARQGPMDWKKNY